MMDNEKNIDRKITDENVEMGKLLEEVARIVNDSGRQITHHIHDISNLMFKLKPPDAEFVYNSGILIGKLDQVVVTLGAYLEAYIKYCDAFAISITNAKEEMH